MERVGTGIVRARFLAISACFVVVLAWVRAAAALSPTAVGVASVVGESQPARDVSLLGPSVASLQAADRVIDNRPLPKAEAAAPGNGGDGALQATFSQRNALAGPSIPLPSVSFEGISNNDNVAVYGGRIVPPDTNGDV